MPALENPNVIRACAVVKGDGTIVKSRGFVVAPAATIRTAAGTYRMVTDFLGAQGIYDAPWSENNPGNLVPFVSCSKSGLLASGIIINVTQINGTQSPFVPSYFDIRAADRADAPTDPDFWFIKLVSFV